MTHFIFAHRPINPLLYREFKRLKTTKRNPSKVLEVGCGDGVMIFDLQKTGLLEEKSLTAIDISKANIRFVQKRFPNYKFVVADAQVLPFKNNVFDFVYSWMVIEHVENPEKMVAEIARVLKKGRSCYVSSIMKKPWAIYFYRKNGEFVLDPTHINEFKSEEEFKNLFLKNGLKLLKFVKEKRRYSLLELVIKALIRLKIIKPNLKLREIFERNKFLRFFRKKLLLPAPGFYQVEVVCSKK